MAEPLASGYVKANALGFRVAKHGDDGGPSSPFGDAISGSIVGCQGRAERQGGISDQSCAAIVHLI
jgi:hypothetical protein